MLLLQSKCTTAKAFLLGLSFLPEQANPELIENFYSSLTYKLEYFCLSTCGDRSYASHGVDSFSLIFACVSYSSSHLPV